MPKNGSYGYGDNLLVPAPTPENATGCVLPNGFIRGWVNSSGEILIENPEFAFSGKQRNNNIEKALKSISDSGKTTQREMEEMIKSFNVIKAVTQDEIRK